MMLAREEAIGLMASTIANGNDASSFPLAIALIQDTFCNSIGIIRIKI